MAQKTVKESPVERTALAREQAVSELNSLKDRYGFSLGEKAVNSIIEDAERARNVPAAVREGVVENLRGTNPELAEKIEGHRSVGHEEATVKGRAGHKKIPSEEKK
jgi:hypothetical protein